MAGPFKIETKPHTITVEGKALVTAVEDRTPTARKKAGRKLVAWWKLDEAKGSSVTDSSGNNLVGTLVGNPQWRPLGGKVGGALEFDGEDDYVDIDESESLDISGDQITVSAWINAERINERQVIAAKTALADNTWLVEINPLDFSDGKLNFFLNTDGRETNSGSESAIDVGTWYHVAFVYNGMEKMIYIDGKFDASEAHSGNIATNDQPVRIASWGGLSDSSQTRHFTGKIDDVRIYNYALSGADIAAIYAGKELGKSKSWIIISLIVVLAVAAGGFAIYRKKATKLKRGIKNKETVNTMKESYYAQKLDDGVMPGSDDYFCRRLSPGPERTSQTNNLYRQSS